MFARACSKRLGGEMFCNEPCWCTMPFLKAAKTYVKKPTPKKGAKSPAAKAQAKSTSSAPVDKSEEGIDIKVDLDSKTVVSKDEEVKEEPRIVEAKAAPKKNAPKKSPAPKKSAKNSKGTSVVAKSAEPAVEEKPAPVEVEKKPIKKEEEELKSSSSAEEKVEVAKTTPEEKQVESIQVDTTEITNASLDMNEEDEELEFDEDMVKEEVEEEEEEDVGNMQVEVGEEVELEANEGEAEEEEEEEHPELPDTVVERQRRKEFEVFIGGLDREASEEDITSALGSVGEIVEVRMSKYTNTGKNKGYAFVRFASAEHAAQAATEFSRTLIKGKSCAVVPSQDNDTIFMGNILKSWKKEQVMEKLKELSLDGIEEVTLVEDPNNEGMNRGYAFLEMATHQDAVQAFKRLAKPDAIFGLDRSAKVAWAQPKEADSSQVKSVFINGLPETWSEEKIKEHFGTYGEIERVTLSRDMAKAKRKDFGFVNFTTREAALACVAGLKDVELPNDDESKVKLEVNLAKFAPKKGKNVVRGGYLVGASTGRGGKQFGGRRGNARGSGSVHGGKRGRFAYAGGKQQIETKDSRSFAANRARGGRGAARGLRRGSGMYRRQEDYPPRGFGRAGGGAYREDFARGGGAYRDDYEPYNSGYPGGHAPLPPPSYAYGPPQYREPGPGMKRAYASLEADPNYYEPATSRGYPRARASYGDSVPVSSGSYYADRGRSGPVSAAPYDDYPPQRGYGGSSSGSYASGYGTADYLDSEVRGSSYYSGREPSRYGRPGAGSSYYY